MRNSKGNRTVRRGFTLIEVLIVIAILLAIGGLVVVNLLPAKDKADIDLQKSQFDQISTAMRLFKIDMNRYPSEEEGLAALQRKDVIADDDQINWRGPYMESDVRNDKWNRPLIYHYPGQLRGEQFYDIISVGPDGQENTADDVTNHDRHKNAEGEFTAPEDSTGPGTN